MKKTKRTASADLVEGRNDFASVPAGGVRNTGMQRWVNGEDINLLRPGAATYKEIDMHKYIITAGGKRYLTRADHVVAAMLDVSKRIGMQATAGRKA